MEYFISPKLDEDHFLSANSSRDLHSDAHQSQFIGGDADENHSQIIEGDTVKLLGGYILYLNCRRDASPHRELAYPH